MFLFFFLVTKNKKIDQAQQLAEDEEVADHDANDDKETEELRKMIKDILIENAKLRKQVNSVIRCALMSRINGEAA